MELQQSNSILSKKLNAAEDEVANLHEALKTNEQSLKEYQQKDSEVNF